MKLALGAAALLLLAAGCDRMVGQEPQAPYSPTLEGRTLVFENPQENPPQRQQLQVTRTVTTEDGSQLVTLTWTSFTGSSQDTFRQKDGSWFLKGENGETRVLPEGFPDKVDRWVDRGFVNTIIGRGRIDLPGVKLDYPDDAGVWVESVPLNGAGISRRTLLVPDLGEVLTLNLRNGKWVPVNRLVSQGFTPLRAVGSAK